jgi:hypothetical protein
MDSRPSGAGSQHHYQHPWIWISSAPSTPTAVPASLAKSIALHQLPPHIDRSTILLPQQVPLNQTQLLHYNKLVASCGQGNIACLPNHQAVATLQPFQPTAPTQVATSSSFTVANPTDYQAQRSGNERNGHVLQSGNATKKKDSASMTGKDGPRKMAGKKKGDQANQLPARPPNSSDRPPLIGPTQSSSVPSTPQQHARKFSFEDREPSPNAGPNHSPRSAYSETNSTLPSLRLPPRQGGCKYETATFRIRRRMPYSIGDERLEKVESSKIKSKLSEDDERKLETDMRELYDRLLPTQHMEENRQKLVKKLEKIFNDEWPGHDIKAHLFGSSGNLLCSDDSDGRCIRCRSSLGSLADLSQWTYVSRRAGRSWSKSARSQNCSQIVSAPSYHTDIQMMQC